MVSVALSLAYCCKIRRYARSRLKQLSNSLFLYWILTLEESKKASMTMKEAVRRHMTQIEGNASRARFQ